MNNFDWGAITFFGVSAIVYVVSLEIRLRNVEAKLAQAKEQVVDNNIRDSVGALSDNDLNSDLAKNLSGGPTKK